MRKVVLSLAQQLRKPFSEGFCIQADSFTTALADDSRDVEGSVLADVLFDHLPGGTIHAMLKRLRERYATLGNQELNPFQGSTLKNSE